MALSLMQILAFNSFSHSDSLYQESQIFQDVITSQQTDLSIYSSKENSLNQPQDLIEDDKITLIAKPSIPEGTILCPETIQTDNMCLDVYEPVCGAIKQNCIGAYCPAKTKTFGNGCGACKNKEVVSYTKGDCEGLSVN